MTGPRRAALLTLVMTLSVIPAFAGGNANGFLGTRIMDEEDWEPVDKPLAIGADVDFGLFGWPVNVAVSLHHSTADDDIRFAGNARADVTGTVTDLSAGVVKAWEVGGNIHPYVGGGLAFVQAEKEADLSGGGSGSEDDSSAGLYLNWGVTWRLGASFNIGVGARVVGGTDLTFGDEEVSADYFQAGLILGYGWN